METAFSSMAKELPANSGVARDDRKELAAHLADALANMYVLYHKTHAHHWNVTGPMFYSVHKLTEEQYTDLAEAIDAVAERIRSIGFAAPVGLSAYLESSAIKDVDGIKPAGDMVAELAQDHLTLATRLRDMVESAEKVGDVYTADLLTARIGVHDEAAWMLNALVENKQ
ncbi:MAG: Dps family protein [Parvularculaceae bacterium]